MARHQQRSPRVGASLLVSAGCGEQTHVRQNAEGVLGAECNEAIRGLLPEDENTPKRVFAIPPCPLACFAHSRFAGLARTAANRDPCAQLGTSSEGPRVLVN